jgi:8-oxo-dGTP pyrophosphatase MutT (NUDIX family)
VRVRRVVTVFLQREPDGRVLLLQRSARVSTYPGKWAGVSGSMEGPDPIAEGLREVREETGLAPPEVEVVRAAPALRAEDAALGIAWEVHPLLARVAEGREPALDWEHVQARWVRPEDVAGLDAVPRLADALWSVLHA